jgi:hypothetical protein
MMESIYVLHFKIEGVVNRGEDDVANAAPFFGGFQMDRSSLSFFLCKNLIVFCIL